MYALGHLWSICIFGLFAFVVHVHLWSTGQVGGYNWNRRNNVMMMEMITRANDDEDDEDDDASMQACKCMPCMVCRLEGTSIIAELENTN